MLHLGVDHGLGHELDLDQLGDGLGRGVAQAHLGLTTRVMAARVRRSSRSAATVSNSEASSAHSSSTSGRTFSLISLTRTRKWSSASLVRVGVLGVELDDVADLGAEELVVDLGHDRAAADLIEVVVGGEALTGSPSAQPTMSMVTLSPSLAGRSTVSSSAKF